MPYITVSRREALRPITDSPIQGPGELNFVFTKLAQQYLRLHGRRYTSYNDIIGALEACKLEMYRRSVVPYENEKIRENSDVY